MKITCLAENTSLRSDINAEHGLSLYIETASHRILFDMGQTELFAENAKKLGVNLAGADLAVLSHGHYDHGGGLRKFLNINSHAPVYINKHAFLPHYNREEKYIGLDTALKNHPRIIYCEDEHRIDDELWLMSCNSLERHHSTDHFGLTEKTDSGFIPDDFRHEQYLLIRDGTKRVLISGCSHKGILNITDWFSPDVLVGGFHFSKMPSGPALEAAAEAIGSYKTKFFTCHCTGIPQYEFMKKHASQLEYLSCGETITV